MREGEKIIRKKSSIHVESGGEGQASGDRTER